jgi:hypothetical protein
LKHILPTQIANNIVTTEKSENQLQVLDFIEVEQSKTQFGVELGRSTLVSLSVHMPWLPNYSVQKRQLFKFSISL